MIMPGKKETHKEFVNSTEEGMKLPNENDPSEKILIPEIAASKIRAMFQERDAVSLEYSKKIDLFLYGVLEGQGIDRSKIESVNWESMEVTIKK